MAVSHLQAGQFEFLLQHIDAGVHVRGLERLLAARWARCERKADNSQHYTNPTLIED